jgi:hypothetical protein
LHRLLALVDMRLAVVTEEKAKLEARFLKLMELRRQVSKSDLGGRKRKGAGLEPHHVHRRAAAGVSRPFA